MKLAKGIVRIVLVLAGMTLFIYLAYASYHYDPNWDVEKAAVRANGLPLAGFWKQGSCEPPWGLAIGPVSPGIYYISFCGPGGCFEKGAYRPNSTIVDDPAYRVLDANTLAYQSEEGWSMLVRCDTR